MRCGLGNAWWLLCLTTAVSAVTIEKWFDITWLEAAPDGFPRRVMGVNNTWPPPILDMNVGDRMILHCRNNMTDVPTSIHFHGLYQNGTNAMDGPVGVTQCGIPPGQSYTYNFTAQQSGLYWWHSHQKGQYPDGLRAPLILHDPNEPYKDEYDEELTISFSDWYHQTQEELIPTFLTLANPTGAEPVPQAALMNDTQNATFPIVGGKTYKINMLNMGAFAAHYVWIQGINMTVIEVDGVYTEKANASVIYLSAAQRYVVLATFPSGANYPIVGAMDEDMFDVVPDGLNANVTSWFVTDNGLPNDQADPKDDYDDLFDDFFLVPVDGMPLLETPEMAFDLNVSMNNLDNGINYAFFNNITYVPPVVPTIFTAMTTGENATNPAIYGEYVDPHILPHNQVIEVVLNNMDPGKHPFHLHGHQFQLVARSDEDGGTWQPGDPIPDAPPVPMRRDTVLVRPNGYLVLRFRADNPGIFLFHCHIEWHIIQGLVTTFVEAPLELQQRQTLPQDAIDLCASQNIKTSGNAVGNTGAQLLNLDGNNVPPNPLPDGFTAKGIVALVFCCVAALLGCGAITFYGIQEIHLGKKVQ